MSLLLYSLRVEPERLVAAEVDAGAAAALLDKGRAVLLSTEAELAQLARRQRKALTLIARGDLDRARRGNSSAASTRRTVSEVRSPQIPRRPTASSALVPAAV